MKRNPVNILNDTMLKATELMEIGIRITIHTKRAKKFSKIDLRHFKSKPERKNRIRLIIMSESLKAKILFNQMLVITSHPIRTQTFEKGSIAIINKK